MDKKYLLLISCAAVFILTCLALMSCDQKGDSGDDDVSDNSFCSKDGYYEQDACDDIVSGYGLNDNCIGAYDWSFSTIVGCLGIIQTFLDSADSCDQVVGECLNTMWKYGYADEEDCRLIAPLNCVEAWEEWNNCLALADSEDC